MRKGLLLHTIRESDFGAAILSTRVNARKGENRNYERELVRWSSGSRSSDWRRFDRWKSFGRGGAESQRLDEDYGSVDSVYCLR